MSRELLVGTAVFFLALLSCEKDKEGDFIGTPSAGNNNNNNNNIIDGWLIPKSEVFDGGPGKDGIPALEEPQFIAASSANYLEEDDLVLGFVNGDDIRAYPHAILDWHEIINDKVGSINLAVTYCPLTGTGIGWNRKFEGLTTTFGVSGLLYNSNLILYDRVSGSNWSQMRLDCVNGNFIGSEIGTYTLVETTWKTWKEMYPSTTVVSSNTVQSRPYETYPYGNYRTNDNYLIFPISNRDQRLRNKDRVHGIVANGNSKVYPLSIFGSVVTVIMDSFADGNYVVVGNGLDNFAVSFNSDPGDGTIWIEPDFSVIHNVEVDTLQIGASGVHMFVGLNGPYVQDNNNDGVVSDETTFKDGAIGFIADNVDLGFVIMTPTLSALPGLGDLLPTFTAATASADLLSFVGFDELTMDLRGIQVGINTGDAWPGGLGPPVVDFSTSFADNELLEFFEPPPTASSPD